MKVKVKFSSNLVKKKLTTDYIYDANSPPIVQLNKAHLMTKMKMT